MPLALSMFALWLNIIPDYLSLLQTRFLLKYMGGRNLVNISIVALDFIMSGVIIAVFVAAVVLAVNAFGGGSEKTGAAVLQFFSNALMSGTNTLSTIAQRTVILTTFATPIWLWLTAMGWFAISLINRSVELGRLLQFALPIDTHPLRSLGEVIAGIVLLVLIVLQMFGLRIDIPK